MEAKKLKCQQLVTAYRGVRMGFPELVDLYHLKLP